ncbi:MAG: helix-turn-helix domain-containing protein [Burkholderiaceae bacterium]
MKIGQVIRHLRQEKNATLEAIAFIAETDAANLSRIERGKQNVTPEILEKIALAFDFSVSSLYLMAEQNIETYQLGGTKEDLKQARQRLDTFVSRFMLLSAANQDLINEFLEVMLKAERRTEQSASKDSLPL